MNAVLGHLGADSLRVHSMLLDRFSDAVIYTDANFAISGLNLAAQKLYGWNAEEARGRELFGLLHTRFIGQRRGEALAQLRTMGVLDTEVIQRNRRGERIFAQIHIALAKDDQGNCIGAAAVLRTNEGLYRSLFEAIEEAVAIVEPIFDENGRAADLLFLAANPAYEAVRGLRAADLVGRTAREVPADRETQWIEICGEVLKSGRAVHYENYDEPAGRWYRTSYVPFRSGQVAVNFCDVTKRKEAQVELQSHREHLAELVKERAAQLERSNAQLKAEIGQRKRAEERAERLLALMNHNPSLIFMKDEQGRYVYINDAYEKEFIDGNDWYGKTDSDFWPKESAELFRAHDREVLEAGRTKQFLEDSRNLAGKRYCWLCYKFPFTDSNGQTYIGGIGIDATERVRMEEALREHERELAEAQRISKIGSWSFDLLSGELKWSEELYNVLGVERSEFAPGYEAFLKQVHPEDVAGVLRMNARARQSGEPFQIEYRIVTPNGVVKSVREIGYAEKDDGGKPVRLFGTTQDITEVRRTESRLARRNSVLEGIARILREALSGRSEEELGRVCISVAQEVTQSKLAVLGEISPRTGALCALGGDFPGLESGSAESVVRGRRVPDLLSELFGQVLNNGKAFFLNPSELHPVLPVCDPELTAFLAVPLIHAGRTVGLLGLGNREGGYSAEDLETAEALAPAIVQGFLAKRVEKGLDAARLTAEKARAAAEHANRAKDHFLAVLSHELRTPLNPALMAATILERSGRLPEDLRSDLSIIRRNVELEARLIDDMLDLTRITRGKIALACRNIDGCEVLRHAVETCNQEAGEKSLEIELTVPDRPIYIRADPARLQQIFWNLLKNAVKFTSPGGRIKVSARVQTEGELRVEVADTGKGIEPEFLPRIFDAFEQGDYDVTRRYGGLGLGLAICKGLVQMHNGRISAASDGPGQGATFAVELPILPTVGEAEPAMPVFQRREGRPQPVSGRCSILLVEDHKSTAVMASRLLESFGHRVKTADCVKSALELFEQEPFDLIISDLGLPDGTGHELLDEITKRRPTKAIALSGFGMDRDIQESMQRGFLEHLIKPVNVEQLEAAIARALTRV